MATFAVVLTVENEDRNENIRRRITENYRSIRVNSGFYLISSHAHTFKSLAEELGISEPDGPYAIVFELQGNYYGFMPNNIREWLNV